MNKILGGVALVLAISLQVPAAMAGTPAMAIVYKADRSVLFDAARFDGDKIVAVGERGLVMQSADEGKTWTGALTSTNRALNTVIYVGDKIGLAAGQGGTLLRTADNGATWTQIKVEGVGNDAILGLTALSDGRVIGYGAFGMYLESTDKGKTWVRKPIIKEGFERHISQIAEIGGGKLLLVGETGTLAISSDMGTTWKELKSPYGPSGYGVEGSLFGVLRLKDGSVLIYGMRGHVYRSPDNKCENWTQIPIASINTFNGGSVAADGRIVLAGNDGMIATSSDNGQSFTLLHTREEGHPLGQALYTKDGALLYVGYLATGRIETPVQKH